jgi:23S rRNA (adenine2503-C2)-methyltransferase
MPADVGRLVNLFNPALWQATVSVVCERNEGLPQTSAHQKELATNFADDLAAAGFNTRTFDPAGQDTIGGGCGQLHFVQQWFGQHANLARPSAGFARPVTHTPHSKLSQTQT